MSPRARAAAPWLLAAGAVVVGLAAGLTILATTDRDPTAGQAEGHTIAEPYAYPAVNLSADPAENVEMLRIPNEVLDAMTTEALAWSVVDYPYFADFMASSQIDGGVDFLREKSDALDALLQRDDAEAATQRVRSAFVNGEVEDEFAELKVMLLEEILADV